MSIGNELIEAWSKSDEGVKRATMLQDFVHKMEPTRQVMLAAQNNHQDKFSGVTDVIGYNYLEARAISDHKSTLNVASLFPKNYLIIVVLKVIYGAILPLTLGV